MQIAFKEWAIVVDALGRGEQIVILRKGGIQEGAHGFQIEHPRFLLFPTLFHQQRESVIPSAQARFDKLAAPGNGDNYVQIEFFAEVVCAQRLLSLVEAERLRGQHLWRDEVIAQRFDWGKTGGIHALALRVHRLPAVVELPELPTYRGCKSWVKLTHDVSTEGAQPVLNDDQFKGRIEQFRSALESPPVRT